MSSGNGTSVAPKVPLPSTAPEPSLPGVVIPPKVVANSSNTTGTVVTPSKEVEDSKNTTDAVVTPVEIP